MARCAIVCACLLGLVIITYIGYYVYLFAEVIVEEETQMRRENHFFRIQSVQTTLLTPSSFSNISTINFNFTFGVKRVIHSGALDYSFDRVSLMYNKKLISDGTFVPFTQQEMEKNSTAEARFVVRVDDEIAAQIRGSGGIEVRVKLAGVLKVSREEYGDLSEKYGAIRVNCKKVNIRFMSNSTAALLKHSQHCKTSSEFEGYYID